MTPYYEDSSVQLHHGDCLEVLRALPDNSVDSVVTDPPYGLEFMGKGWDSFGRGEASSNAVAGMTGTGYTDGAERLERPSFMGGTNPKCRNCQQWQRGGNPCTCDAPNFPNERRARSAAFGEWCEEWSIECLRVLKPGGHLLAFGGSRTWHRLAVAVEDAGFEIRDSIAWLYGSGFAKSWNFNTQYKGEWCACTEEKAVPYNHASNPEMRGLWNDVHEAPESRGEGQDADVLTEVQRGASRGRMESARPQRAGGVVSGDGSDLRGVDSGSGESGMEGRLVHRAGQGLPDDSESRPSKGAGERVRGGASVSHGDDDRASSGSTRGSASQESSAGGQSTGESDPLPGSHGALDDGALRGRADCPTCGGLRKEYRGYGSALKPAFEPIVVGRKPLAGTVAANVLTHGTGALNVDGCRVNPGSPIPGGGGFKGGANSRHEGWTRPSHAEGNAIEAHTAGRWPANVILDGSQADALDAQSGVLTSGLFKGHRNGDKFRTAYGEFKGDASQEVETYGDSGGASRFFPIFRYEAKAPTSERPRDGETAHPTVKPLDLMAWLVRLVTPPGGTVLEPFAGSGTTAEACVIEGFKCIAIEREATYLPLIVQRLSKPIQVGLDFGSEGVAL